MLAEAIYVSPPQVLVWVRNVHLKGHIITTPWFLSQSCLSLSRLGCFQMKPNGKRHARNAPDVLQTPVPEWPQDQARLLWSKAVGFTHAFCGCLGPQHQLYHSTRPPLLLCRTGCCVGIACVVLKEVREAVRTGHMMTIGNSGILPLMRTVVVLVCDVRTEMTSGSS